MNDLALEREAREAWSEKHMIQQAICGATDVLGILGYSVDEYSKGRFRDEKE